MSQFLYTSNLMSISIYVYINHHLSLSLRKFVLFPILSHISDALCVCVCVSSYSSMSKCGMIDCTKRKRKIHKGIQSQSFIPVKKKGGDSRRSL